MVPIPIWATTLMAQIETLYINIMKLENIFKFKYIFAVLIHYVCIYMYIYYIILYYIILCYIMLYYIILHYITSYYIILYYIILWYIIYVYIYIYQQGFPYWGIGSNPPTSQKFAHSRHTGNNFFPHQRLVQYPLNKNFHVINQ